MGFSYSSACETTGYTHKVVTALRPYLKLLLSHLLLSVYIIDISDSLHICTLQATRSVRMQTVAGLQTGTVQAACATERTSDEYDSSVSTASDGQISNEICL